MPLQTSGQISYGDARSEGGKSSWVNPSYPNVESVNQFNINANWIIDKDESNTIGYNTDGSFPITKVYGWDTWNRPTIEWCYIQQFAKDGGIRVAWKASGGDLWRTGWTLLISSTGYPTVPSSTALHHAYGTENNPNATDLRLQYANGYSRPDRNISVLQGNITWYDYAEFGGYSKTTQEPASSLKAVPDGTVEPTAYFSAISETPTVDNSTAYYVTLVGLDARQFDQLGFDRSDNVFTLNRGSTNYNSGPSKQATYGAGWSYFDGKVGDGSLVLFNQLGTTTIQNIMTRGFDIDIENAYLFYLGGSNLYHWVYVTDKTNDLGHPYYPDDGANLPSGHPYESPTTDDFTTFELDKWVRYEGDPIAIRQLTDNTNYDVFTQQYVEDDLDRYNINNTNISAPENGVSYNTDSVKTDQAQLATPTSLTVDNFDGFSTFTMNWNYSSSAEIPDTYKFEYRVNGGAWKSNDVTVSNTSNWSNTTNPKSADVQTNTAWSVGDTFEFRVKAVKSGYLDSAWSNIASYS